MSKEIDAGRGSLLWSLNTFRSAVLSNLLDDLMIREKIGLTSEQCEQVKFSLGKVINAAAGFPDGGFLNKAVWKEIEKMSDLYEKWNEIHDDDEKAIHQRKKLLKKLRHQRNKIARRIRRNQYIISQELDLKVVESLYTAMGDLAKTLPEIFVNLAKAINKYAGVVGKS